MNESASTPAETESSDPRGGAARAGGTRPARRALGWLLAAFGVLLTAVVLGLLFLLGTQTGLRAAFAVLDELAPEMIDVGRVEGRVLGRLELGELALSVPGLDAQVGTLVLDWRPGALLTGTLRVTQLSARDLTLVSEPAPKTKPSEPFELPSIRLPLAVDIEQLLVENLVYEQAGAPPEAAIRLTRAELRAEAGGETLDLKQLTADLAQPDAHLQASGRVGLADAHPVSLALDWGLRQSPALEVDGDGAISGDLTQLAVTHRITGSVEASLDARVRQVLEQPSWDANLSLEAIALPEIVADAPELDLRAELKSEGDLEQAAVTGTLRGEAPSVAEIGRLAADLDIEWADQVLTIKALRLTESSQGPVGTDSDAPAEVGPLNARVDLTGRLDMRPAVPTLAMQAVWERLRWPLAGDPLIELPQGSLNAEGAFDDYAYRLRTSLFGQPIPETEIALVGTGDRQQTSITELSLNTLGGQVNAKGLAGWAPAPSWDLAITANGIDPGLQWPGLDGRVELKADSRGDLEDGFSYGLKVDASLERYPAALINLSGSGTGDQLTLGELSIETLGGLVEGEGELAWAQTPAWSLKLAARDIDPGQHFEGLAGVIRLSAESEGDLEEGYRFSLTGNAAMEDYPPVQIDLAGQGGAESAKLETLTAEVIDGRLDGSGTLTWAPSIAWEAELVLDGLDPGQLLADWPGTLGGRIQSEGTTVDDGLELSARISDFGGELRGYPVQLQTELAMLGQRIDLKRLEARSGETRLTASGRADQKLDFRYAFRSPSLAALVPALQGQLGAEGSVEGTLAAPRVTVELDGRDIELEGQGIERIDLTADVGLDPESPLQLDLTASNLIAGGQRVETLALRGRGSMRSHQLDAEISSDLLRLTAAADGGLSDRGEYRGELGQLALETEDYGRWSLQKPMPYAVVGASLDVGPLCIADGNASRGCAAFQRPEAGRFVASLDLERLGFDLLDQLTPELISPEGYLQANARFEGRGDLLTGTARMSVPDGALEVVLPRASQTLTFSGTELAIRSDADGIDARFQLPVDQAGRFDARVGLPGFRLTATGQQPLRGQLEINLDGLDRFAALVPDLQDVGGQIDGDIGLSGTLGQPQIRGNLSVLDLALRVPAIGLEIAELNLTAASEGASRMRLKGGALIGGGQLDLDGAITGIGDDEPSLELELTGDALTVADTKEYNAVLSMNLEAGLGLGGGAVNGEIKLPRARIMPRTIPAGAVQPSQDVVVEEEANEQEPFPLSVDVLAKLGEDVLIEAFGLRGQLRGQLRVTKEPGGAMLGDGELQVIDGTYRVSLPGLGLLTSVGKPLVIEKGIVVYAKTPLDNPGIILSAQRQGGDITAGVRVFGTLRNPKLAFFSDSDPNMTQSEITSYLVTGIPPKRDATTDDRSISVGTYVAPKLFMEYDTSLGDQSDSIKMRYDLTESIQVQSETGDAQGVDIFYKFEN
ncbi:translocation/assembly module TamB domain-containing protein [Halochromatium glycolicum]|uniref:Translocation and assembly module TamB C-terminal domain-containing protein n=1 Tax=Halochromatium glycolicum TaxID=85075 RepID=A0AAJ0X8I3_9GAMM|nr:translocation/assembly module TamB domain-containing protein [Halochromatium glycolicum]MBK1703939.1 hypothetical protein [Halochromatium glycolicum]